MAAEPVMEPEIDLLSLAPGSTSYTYLREIMVIIEHNAYRLQDAGHQEGAG
jgi:hypothetical protein